MSSTRTACLAWSAHAAELAEALHPHMVRWEDSPTTFVLTRDGLLQRLAPGVYIPPDLLDSAITRILALGLALGEDLRSCHVVCGASAAWVWCGGRPPHTPELLSSAHRSVITGVQVRTMRMTPAELETLGGAPVTAPRRTAVDLLRSAQWERDVAWVQALLHSGHVTTAEIQQTLASSTPLPGLRRAQQRFSLLREHAEASSPAATDAVQVA